MEARRTNAAATKQAQVLFALDARHASATKYQLFWGWHHEVQLRSAKKAAAMKQAQVFFAFDIKNGAALKLYVFRAWQQDCRLRGVLGLMKQTIAAKSDAISSSLLRFAAMQAWCKVVAEARKAKTGKEMKDMMHRMGGLFFGKVQPASDPHFKLTFKSWAEETRAARLERQR